MPYLVPITFSKRCRPLSEQKQIYSVGVIITSMKNVTHTLIGSLKKREANFKPKECHFLPLWKNTHLWNLPLRTSWRLKLKSLKRRSKRSNKQLKWMFAARPIFKEHKWCFWLKKSIRGDTICPSMIISSWLATLTATRRCPFTLAHSDVI